MASRQMLPEGFAERAVIRLFVDMQEYVPTGGQINRQHRAQDGSATLTHYQTGYLRHIPSLALEPFCHIQMPVHNRFET